MAFYTYDIKDDLLKPMIKNILFRYSEKDEERPYILTTYAENRIRLGVLNKKRFNKEIQYRVLADADGVTSYLTGIHLKPERFLINDIYDEICIDFTPKGFLHFFRMGVTAYISRRSVLARNFGDLAYYFFSFLFEENDFEVRGQSIEAFLIQHIRKHNQALLEESVVMMDECKGAITMNEVCTAIQCNKIIIKDEFVSRFNILPDQILRIIKFNKALELLTETNKNLEEIAYDCFYTNCKHLIQEFLFFTDCNPANFRKSLIIRGEQAIPENGRYGNA